MNDLPLSAAEVQHPHPVRRQEVEQDEIDSPETPTQCWVHTNTHTDTHTQASVTSISLPGDQEIAGGCYYWELCPLLDWKSFSVGVAYKASLGRFDQLGKNGGSWCLHASQWLQTSLSVKHNNRAKALDWPLPQRIGIYCDCTNGIRIHLLQLCLIM